MARRKFTDESLLTLIAKGFSDKQIARELNVSLACVCVGVRRLFRQHKVNNRVLLALIHHGIKP